MRVTNPGGGTTELADGVTILGTGTSVDKFRVANPVPSGGTTGQVLTPTGWSTLSSSTSLVDGVTTDVSGTGTVADPYKVEVVNLQKIISSNYTLQSSDDNYDVFIDTSAGDVTITVPAGLVSKIQVCFFRKGINEAIFTSGAGVTLHSPDGFKIRGNDYWAYLTQIGSTNEYQLAGALTA